MKTPDKTLLSKPKYQQFNMYVEMNLIRLL